MKPLLVAVLAVSLAGCALTEEDNLRSQIWNIVPADAVQQRECEYASGFVENAPANLRCRFLVQGRVAEVAASIQQNLVNAGLRVEHRDGAGPSARLLYGRSSTYAVHLALIAEGRNLFFQLGQAPVPVGRTGIDVTVAQTE